MTTTCADVFVSDSDETSVLAYIMSLTGRLCHGVTPQPQHALTHIVHALAELGLSAGDIVQRSSERLDLGHQRYGELSLASDTRDWSKEMVEELLDALVYGACAELRGWRP